MPTIPISLVEEAVDFRSREIAILFKLTNTTPEAVQVVSVSPKIPDGVELIETRESSLLSTKARHTRLCKELNELAMNCLMVTNDTFRAKITDVHRAYVKSIMTEFGGWFGILRLGRDMVTRQWIRQIERERDLINAYSPGIEDSKDAQPIHDRFIVASELPESIKELFAIKLQKLVECETLLGRGADVKTSAIASVEPGESFNVRYLLRFPRKLFESASFSVSVTSVYKRGDTTQHCSATDSCAILVSPNAITLSAVAIAAAILGVTLKQAVIAMGTTGDSVPLGVHLQGAETIAGSVLAFIVFNVYEFTDLFKSLRTRLSWRQALFIGVICGIGVQRVFETLNALVGIGAGS